ncbi:MAG: hypothetical protein V5783_00265 [Pontiella sp.]
MTYDPAIHHRRSIRLKSHDYSGGGEYFITVCAHREFVEWAGSKPFHAHGVQAILEEEWRKGGEVRTRENALRRNRLVAEWCNTLWIPAARRGGSLESVKQEFKDKLIQGENR